MLAHRHVCDALAPGGCSDSVCKVCCSDIAYYANATVAECMSCVHNQCEYDCADPAAVCTRQCIAQCWSELGSAPCLRDCTSCHGVGVTVAVVVPFAGRLGADYLKNKLLQMTRVWLQKNFACCMPRGLTQAGNLQSALLFENHGDTSVTSVVRLCMDSLISVCATRYVRLETAIHSFRMDSLMQFPVSLSSSPY